MTLGAKMKRVIVVSKTHLDLGFTDFASKIKKKYIEEYIPAAIELAEKLNKNGEKRFVWTTGSWILKEALLKGDGASRARLKKAIASGNIERPTRCHLQCTRSFWTRTRLNTAFQ